MWISSAAVVASKRSLSSSSAKTRDCPASLLARAVCSSSTDVLLRPHHPRRFEAAAAAAGKRLCCRCYGTSNRRHLRVDAKSALHSAAAARDVSTGIPLAMRPQLNHQQNDGTFEEDYDDDDDEWPQIKWPKSEMISSDIAAGHHRHEQQQQRPHAEQGYHGDCEDGVNVGVGGETIAAGIDGASFYDEDAGNDDDVLSLRSVRSFVYGSAAAEEVAKTLGGSYYYASYRGAAGGGGGGDHDREAEA